MSAPSPPVISNTIPRGTPNLLEFWWDPPTTGTVTSYRIQCPALSIDSSYGSDERYAYFSVPSNNVSYQFQITALNGVAESDPAVYPPWEAGVPSTPPTGVTGQLINSSTLSMSWTPPVTSNRIQYCWATGTPLNPTNPDDHLDGTVQYVSSTSGVITNIDPNRAYNFNVRAFSCPGWSDQSASLTYGRVYGTFVTNALVIASFSGIDTNGNQILLLSPRTLSVPMTLYDRFGNAVQTIPGSQTGFGNYYLTYISADGYSNLWMARVLCTGFSSGSFFTFFTNFQFNALFDTNGNIIFPVNVFANITIFDKTGATVAALTSPGNILSNFYGYIIKFSPTGIWTGAGDPNTWVARFVISGSVASTNHRTAITGLVLDKDNNIIVSGVATNFSGTTQTVSVFDQTQSLVGTAFTVPGTLNGVTFTTNTGVFIKYGANGLAASSWRGYVTSVTSSQLFVSTRVNQHGQVIVATRYRDPTPQVIGSDDSVVGNTLPFTSSLGGSGYTDTVLIRFCSTGVASASWRAPIYSSSLNTLSKYDIPISVLIDSNDNIYCTGASELGVPGDTTVPLFVCASNDTTFISTVTLGYNNIFTAKYNNTGSPLWVTLLRGTNQTSNTFNTAFNTYSLNWSQTTPQYFQTSLDRSENVCLIGPYNRNSFEVINRNDSVVYTTNTPGVNLSNNSTFTATYVVKLVDDGSNANVAILNSVSTNTVQFNFIYPIRHAVNSSNEMFVYTQNNTPDTSLTSSIQTGIYGYTGTPTISPNFDLSTNIITPLGYNLVTKFTSSLSTVSIAQLQQSSFIVGAPTLGGYMKIDSNDNVILTGIYRSRLDVSDFGSSEINISRQVPTSFPNSLGLYVAKLTGTPSNSWVGQTGMVGGTSLNDFNQRIFLNNQIFFPIVNFQVNLSTNSIFGGAQTLSSLYTLYDGYNSTVKLMGFQSTNLSNVTFFSSYPSDGRVSLV